MGTNIEVTGYDWIIFIDDNGKEIFSISAEDALKRLRKKE